MGKTKIIGLTGGIGSGKSIIAQVFASMGTPVFDADSVAKSIYDDDPSLLTKIRAEIGSDVFDGEHLNKTKLAQKVFNDPVLLTKLNAWVHPAVKSRFQDWLQQQQHAYVIREAAILIESNSYQDCDEIILVTAPEDLRKKRIALRSGLTASEIEARMSRQWSDDQKRPYCQYELINDEKELITPQIFALHQKFMV